jgi:hypothetical protein
MLVKHSTTELHPNLNSVLEDTLAMEVVDTWPRLEGTDLETEQLAPSITHKHTLAELTGSQISVCIVAHPPL